MANQPNLIRSSRPGFDWQIAAPAKINRFLHILGRRDDGYHDLQTGFQFLEWADYLHFRAGGEFSVTGLDWVADQDNLVWQAGMRLAEYAGIAPSGTLHIEKHLPAGAGLGGGSSDAASALLLLRHQWSVDISDQTLMSIGASLGADVPIFLYGRAAIGTGIGEQLSPAHWPEQSITLYLPDVHVPTAQIFCDPLLTRNSTAITMRAALDGQGHNDCETVCRRQFPAVDRLMTELVEWDPKLSGSGGTVFSLVEAAPISKVAKTHLSRTTNDSSAIQS